ncbi:hypothetical protein AVEN_14329-1 [Araneus ventricosus]|uniref:Uncharacterized protein n=1 Tax=Araneus ventricosus TaxID=182803 RepID=A0A4Y2WYU0_ARAVE|nr:hypothetical protein AVEN_14329-1 [Araneus ventricosus]
MSERTHWKASKLKINKALRRNVPLGQNFESFQAAASDATRILTRNINAEWQKLEKYKELADAKEEEKISSQERLRQLHENKNIIEKQLVSAERRTQTLKNSDAELKRSLNNIRRQEDKSSRDFKAEKQMLDEKLAYYQAKWRERYETRYANKPLIQEFEKAKKALANKREELKLLKSALHECKANIFKAKCERGKRNAEESGFYPLESFIIRVASIGAEVRKLETEESQLLSVVAILQQHINNKEKLAQLEAQNAKEVVEGKTQPSTAPEKVRKSTFFKNVSEGPMKRKEITESSYSIPQKIIGKKEDSLLNKYGIKKSKPIQGVVAQTSMRQNGNECSKEGIQEEKIRNRIEKLKLYTPKFFSPPDLLSKNVANDSSSKRIRRQSNDSFVSENCQTSHVKGIISNHKSDLQMRPTESKNSNATPVKALNIDTSRERLQELTNKTLQNVQKVDSAQRYASFLKETAVQSKSYVPPTFQNFKEKSKMNEANDYISSKPTKYAELMGSDATQNFLDRRGKESRITNETDSLKTSQELFPNSDKQMQSTYYNKYDSSDILEKMPESCKKPPRFQKEINSPKVFREFYEGGVKEMRSVNDINVDKTRPFVANEKYTIYSNEISLPTSGCGSLTNENKSFEALTETNLSRVQEARKEETRKREEYETAALEIVTKHRSYRNAQSTDNIGCQKFHHNELKEDPPILENDDEQLAYKEDIGKHQNIQLAQKIKTSSVSEKLLQEHTDHMDEEMQDINKKQQSILTTSHESKNSLSTSSNDNQEPMDTDNFQDMQNIVEDNVHDKEYMIEDTVYPDFKNLSKEKLESTIFMDVEENQPASMVPNSSVVIVDEIQNQTHGNDSEVINHSKNILRTSTTSNVSYCNLYQALQDNRDNQSKNILPTSAESNVSYSNLNQASQGFGNDRINSSLSQDTVKVQGVAVSSLMKPTERPEESNEVNMQGETEPPNYTNESQLVKSQPISQLNLQEPEEVPRIKYQENPSSGNSELIENGAAQNGTVEAGVFPCSSKSTTSSEMQYHTPKSTDFSSKIHLSFHSPATDGARTPVRQEARTGPSPFDFEKHIKILGDLKQTPTFVYQTRQMYKSGNDSPPKEAEGKMPQEPSEIGKDIFSTFSFLEVPTAGKESGPKSTESEKSKTEETGFLSFALEDYLTDSLDSPVEAGKEKSMFAFSCDSPKDGVKSPSGFFPLFAADTQETAKETKSGFVLNFGGDDKAQEDTSSFKFLF